MDEHGAGHGHHPEKIKMIQALFHRRKNTSHIRSANSNESGRRFVTVKRKKVLIFF
jgi:hypothetical protein